MKQLIRFTLLILLMSSNGFAEIDHKCSIFKIKDGAIKQKKDEIYLNKDIQTIREDRTLHIKDFNEVFFVCMLSFLKTNMVAISCSNLRTKEVFTYKFFYTKEQKEITFGIDFYSGQKVKTAKDFSIFATCNLEKM